MAPLNADAQLENRLTVLYTVLEALHRLQHAGYVALAIQPGAEQGLRETPLMWCALFNNNDANKFAAYQSRVCYADIVQVVAAVVAWSTVLRMPEYPDVNQFDGTVFRVLMCQQTVHDDPNI